MSVNQTALNAFVARHGARVRRSQAMGLLGIRDGDVFKKVVDANPELKHKLTGEGQTKYLTSVIFGLVGTPGEGTRPTSAARCATSGGDKPKA